MFFAIRVRPVIWTKISGIGQLLLELSLKVGWYTFCTTVDVMLTTDISLRGVLFCEQVHMFLSKLTSTSIGLTAWDMVVISKPTVLMV